MKKIIFLLIIGFLSNILIKAQVKKLNDPSIVAQHKRMVYESWGDWRPYPKYVLGVQTNFAYATVWGWLSPSINQQYKDGQDIRPLKPTGLEVQRLAQLELERKQAEEIKLQIDSLYARNVQDFAHWTPVTVDADPLWLLYYKKMLTPLNSFPNQPSDFMQWGFDNSAIYDQLLINGGIEKLQEKLDILKDSYKNSRSLPMPRGKRFLMYHNTLIGWRDLMKDIRSYNQRAGFYINIKNKLPKFGNGDGNNMIYYNDVHIVKAIMTKYSNKF